MIDVKEANHPWSERAVGCNETAPDDGANILHDKITPSKRQLPADTRIMRRLIHDIYKQKKIAHIFNMAPRRP